MVIVVIYLDVDKSPTGLVEQLLQMKLISAASIDYKNELFIMKAGKMVQTCKTVITAQTKALLFSEIESWIDRNFKEKIPMMCIPIISSNRCFETSLLRSTKKI